MIEFCKVECSNMFVANNEYVFVVVLVCGSCGVVAARDDRSVVDDEDFFVHESFGVVHVNDRYSFFGEVVEDGPRVVWLLCDAS